MAYFKYREDRKGAEMKLKVIVLFKDKEGRKEMTFSVFMPQQDEVTVELNTMDGSAVIYQKGAKCKKQQKQH